MKSLTTFAFFLLVCFHFSLAVCSFDDCAELLYLCRIIPGVLCTVYIIFLFLFLSLRFQLILVLVNSEITEEKESVIIDYIIGVYNVFLAQLR